MKYLFLVPTPISSHTANIPPDVIELIANSSKFICERIRTSRRFIKSAIPQYDIDKAQFIELDKNENVRNNREVIQLLASDENICFMSEAGAPCIADPGAQVVNLARLKGYQIKPMSGPSSILLALMASGLNGQQFMFRGYLPVKKDALKKELKNIERTIIQTGYSQIFIETPYRNSSIYEQILSNVNPSLRLHIAFHIQSEDEYLNTKTLKEWKKDQQIMGLLKSKAPCIFILGK